MIVVESYLNGINSRAYLGQMQGRGEREVGKIKRMPARKRGSTPPAEPHIVFEQSSVS